MLEDPVIRARHLALASDVPDVKVAAVLDDAAHLASGRGASAVAAELAEQALRLTPPDPCDERRRRALAAARAQHAAGEWTRAQGIALDLLGELEPGPQRADVLVFLAGFEVESLGAPLLEEALPQADPALQLRIRIRLAYSRRFMTGFAAAFDEVRAALAAAEDIDDDALRVSMLNMAASLGRVGLDPEIRSYAIRAREIAASGDTTLLKDTVAALGQVLIDREDFDAARALLEREYENWRERDERLTVTLLWSLAWLELWSGRFERSADYAARSHELSIQHGAEAHQAPLPGAWAAACRGQFEHARALAERGLALCGEQIGVAGPLFPGVLGLVSFWSGDVEAGVEHFAEADRIARAVDWRNPHMRPWTADYVEALLELGRIEEAVGVLDVWESDARALRMSRVLAAVMRCRGLAAAAEGRIDLAAELLEQAAAQHEQTGDRFGHARALLGLGVARRRRRQKRSARDVIEAALAEFEQIGAMSWVEKARSELGQIGGRTRTEGLTAAERRVAALVAEGRTNKEVAAALFVGERTVETHLSHVYAKLGVRSRAELARTLAIDQSSGRLTISS
jgi:DNA-binding CsgD family transcriptional regulator